MNNDEKHELLNQIKSLISQSKFIEGLIERNHPDLQVEITKFIIMTSQFRTSNANIMTRKAFGKNFDGK